jgi:hypothetical protein
MAETDKYLTRSLSTFFNPPNVLFVGHVYFCFFYFFKYYFYLGFGKLDQIISGKSVPCRKFEIIPQKYFVLVFRHRGFNFHQDLKAFSFKGESLFSFYLQGRNFFS